MAETANSSTSSAPANESEGSAPSGRGPARGAKAAAIFAGVLFLGLAGLQVFSVLSRPAGSVAADDLASLADPRTTRWILRADERPDGRPLASAFFDERRRRLLVGGAGLPEIRADEVFVLWGLDRADDGRSPRRLAAWRPVDRAQPVVVGEAPMPAELKALAVSVETNPQATGPTKDRVVATGSGS